MIRALFGSPIPHRKDRATQAPAAPREQGWVGGMKEIGGGVRFPGRKGRGRGTKNPMSDTGTYGQRVGAERGGGGTDASVLSRG